jgi:hypothetical protein
VSFMISCPKHVCMHVGMLTKSSGSPQLGSTPAQQADDLALAKAMQEQERAFHRLVTQAAQPDEQQGAA